MPLDTTFAIPCFYIARAYLAWRPAKRVPEVRNGHIVMNVAGSFRPPRYSPNRFLVRRLTNSIRRIGILVRRIHSFVRRIMFAERKTRSPNGRTFAGLQF